METVSPAPAATSVAPAFARPLSQDESAHIQRLRDWLHADGTDASDPAALDARWARLLATHPPEAPAPAGVSAAIGIAVGDLLVASVQGALWMMCPGPEGATPGVLLRERPNMPVLPVLDAHARWRLRTPGWTVDYVQRASAHLSSLAPRVPQPHPAPEPAPTAPVAADDALPVPAAPAAPVADDALPVPAIPAPAPPADDALPVPAVPTPPADDALPVPGVPVPEVPAAQVEDFLVTSQPADAPVEDLDDAALVPETSPALDGPADTVPTEDWSSPSDEPVQVPAWTPVIVEGGAAHDEAPARDTPWTPTLVTGSAPGTGASDDTPWTPTLVGPTDDEPAGEAELDDDTTPARGTPWTPTLVTEATDATETSGTWTPTVVTDGAEAPAVAWRPTLVGGTTTEEPAAQVSADDAEEPAAQESADDADEPAEDTWAQRPQPLVWPRVTAEADVATAPTDDAPVAALDEHTASDAAPDEDAPARTPETWTPVLAFANPTTPVEELATPEPVADDPADDLTVTLDALAAPLTGAHPIVPAPAASAPVAPEPALSAPTPVAPEPAVSAPTPVVPVPTVSASTPVVPDAALSAPTPVVPVPSTPTPVVPALTPALGLPVTTERPLTPEDLPYPPSERVQDLALRALELALDRAVKDPAGSAPFVLVREGWDVEVVDFEHSDAGVAEAREAARRGGYSAAAVAWTSPADDVRPFPRVVVDASSAGRPGLRVAHAYAHDEHGGREIGGPQVVGQSAPVV